MRSAFGTVLVVLGTILMGTVALFSLLFGLVVGTWIRLRMDRPERYFVAAPPIGSSLGASHRPFDVGDAGACVLDPRQDEEQIG